MKDLRPAAQFDSDLDVLLHSNINAVSEQFIFQVLKKVHPLVNSLHDILISSAQLPVDNGILLDTVTSYTAPLIENYRSRILWSDYGIEEYQKLLEPKLDELTSRWFYPESLSNITKEKVNYFIVGLSIKLLIELGGVVTGDVDPYFLQMMTKFQANEPTNKQPSPSIALFHSTNLYIQLPQSFSTLILSPYQEVCKR